MTESKDDREAEPQHLFTTAADDALIAACARVDRSRLDNSSYAAAHRDEIPKLASSALMQRLGYDYSMP